MLSPEPTFAYRTPSRAAKAFDESYDSFVTPSRTLQLGHGLSTSRDYTRSRESYCPRTPSSGVMLFGGSLRPQTPEIHFTGRRDEQPRAETPSRYYASPSSVTRTPDLSSLRSRSVTRPLSAVERMTVYSTPPRPMVTDSCTMFIPPQRADDRGKPVVVLDLDETLIFARNGPVVARPGLANLLRTMHGRCEVVVWTAGEREYALEAIQRIDPQRCIQHCVYRHSKWWTGRPGYSKNLNALGRPLESTILVENTPDCTKDNPLNSILVKDFHGAAHRDDTLFVLADVIESVIHNNRRHHITDILLGHEQLALREVPCDSIGSVKVFTLNQDEHPPVHSYSTKCNYDVAPSWSRR